MISARNQLQGTITSIKHDNVMSEVVVRSGEMELVSVITRTSAEAMRLAPGDRVTALIKSTEVMIAKE
ncbi:MAG: molybdopterin-binding protein [Vicinamibacterales bacterium]